MHEILTVQFGTQANYVGTHFWNTQETYFTYGDEDISPVDHNIHFRAGVAPNGSETFTPRALVYDLKENFGALKKVEGEYVEETNDADGVWSRTVPLQPAAPIPPHPYITSFFSSIGPHPTHASNPLHEHPPRYFTDISHLTYHPRSILPIPYLSVPHQASPFQNFASGESLFRDYDVDGAEGEGDVFERDVRWWVEECDQLQGVNVVMGEGWGGFAAKWVERWSDEMGGGKAVFVWECEDREGQHGQERRRQPSRPSLLRQSLTLTALLPYTTLYTALSTPLKPPQHLSLQPTPWHTSALQSIILETALLPSRLRNGSTRRSMNDIADLATEGGKRKVVGAEMSIWDAEEGVEKQTNGANGINGLVNGHSDRMDIEDAEEEIKKLDIDLFTRDIQLPRGNRTRTRREKVFTRVQVTRSPDERGNAVEAAERWGDGPIVESFAVPLAFSPPTSFPPIFPSIPSAHPLAVRTALRTSSKISTQIRQMEQVVRMMIGVDEREALSDELQTLCGEYEEGWDSGSEESDG